VIDIGASDGSWTAECRQVFPNAKYFLIDPLPQNVLSLKALAQANANVRFWNGALGAIQGNLELHVHGDQSSALESESFHGEKISVEEKILDLLVEEFELQPPFLMKADVQGMVLEVLRGANETLKQCEMLLLELSIQRICKDNCLAHEVISYLGEQGFNLYDIASYIKRPRDGAFTQMDAVFVPGTSRLVSEIGW
jgi:FkbM family methyltransferase